VKKLIALLFLIGLMQVSAVYAQQAPAGAAATPAPAPQIDIKQIKYGDDFLTLNFTNVEISALVKVMSELTRRNFILDERVVGKITLMTPTKMSPDEAYQVFLSALEIKGFTAIEDGKVVRIIQTASARQSGLKVYRDGDTRGQGYVTKLVRMNYVNPQEIVRTVTPLMTKDGSLIAYQPTNSIIITDAVSNIRKIESLIQAMDVPAPEGKGKINVYYLRHANAEDIAKIMQALVSRLPAPQAGGAGPAAGPSTILEGTVTITADKSTNSLVIVGSPGDYETVKDVLQKLDIRRRQVYVEAAIVEMSLTKSLDVGFEFQYVDKNNINNTGASSVAPYGGTNFGNIGNVITGGPAGLAAVNGLVVAAIKGAFTYNGVQFLNVGALIHALQANGDVNVLSTPNLLTTDNQKAEIMVGSNIPFVTGQSQNAATGGTAILTSVERKDVGITLKLTPQITSDDSVRLDIYQEISDVIDTPGLDPNKVGPSTSKRSASTTVVVKDRQTMVIGGLIRDNVKSSSSKVPLLGDIPLLGWLFKTKNSSVDKTNLMIFITPYIIKSEFDAEDLTSRKTDAQEKFRQEHRIDKKGFEPVQQKSTSSSQSSVSIEKIETDQKTGVAPAIQSAPVATVEKQDAGTLLKSNPTITGEKKDPMPMLNSAPTSTPVKKESVAPQSAPTTTVPLSRVTKESLR
jgi:general secretion pathway protein D